MKKGGIRLHIGAGFCLTASVLFYVGGVKLLLAVLLADGVHEMGHVTALLLTGAEGVELRLNAGGAVIGCDFFPDRRGELVAVAAGPGAGLLLGLGCLAIHRPFALYLAAAALLSTAFNLLPALPLDGGRMAEIVLSEALPERVCGVLLRISGSLSAAFVVYIGCSLRCIFAIAAGVYLAVLVNFPRMR